MEAKRSNRQLRAVVIWSLSTRVIASFGLLPLHRRNTQVSLEIGL